MLCRILLLSVKRKQLLFPRKTAMPNFIDAFTRAKPRLLAMTPLIAAGAVASFAMAPGLPAAVLVALAGLAGNIAATDVHAMLSRRVLSGDVLTNHDLARAVRRAISEVIGLAAADVSDRRQRAALEKIAVIDENLWAEAEATIWQPETVEGLSSGDTIEMFSKSPEEFARFKALEPEAWRAIVSGLAAMHSFAVEGDPFSSPGATVVARATIDAAASRLHETFPRALYEILKDDFANGGEAYGGLLMKLVGNISAKQVETLEAAYEILNLTRRIFDNTEEIKQRVKELQDALRDLSGTQARAKRLAVNLPPFNPIFTGRTGVLADLKAALERNKRAALSGMPGVGKTQTATEYAHRQYGAQTYDYVLYARAASETELLTDFVSAAHALNLPSKNDANFDVVAASVKAWLEGAERWLLIFDNADDLTVVREHIPANAKGHVIFTRRPDDAGGVADTIRIEEMEADEGAWLLLKRAELTKGARSLNEVTPETAEQARAISRELGGLPLSLDIAGAFIKTTPNTSLAEYLTLYRAAEGKQLRRERDPNAPYEHSVATAFGLAFKQIATPDDETEESGIIARAAADLLRLCAFLAPDAIPLDIILADASALGEDLERALGNTIWRKKVIARATRYSLIDANPKTPTYDMHREVQAVMRDELDDAAQRLWTERASYMLAATFPDVREFANWEACDLFLPHSQACLEYCGKLNIETEAVALLKNRAAFHLDSRARYKEAEPLFTQALELFKKLFGSEHPNIAQSMNNLALIYYAQGRYDEAEPLYKRALELRKKLLSLEHPDVALTMNNLSALYYAQGRYEEAEPLFKQALAMFEKMLGVNHPTTRAVRENFKRFQEEKAAREAE